MSQYQVPPSGGYPDQGAGYPAQVPEGQQPTEVTVETSGGLGLPDEFNHLFRDSTPQDRRSIDRGPNRIGAAQAGFGQQQASAFPQQGGYPAAENGYPAQQGYAPQQGGYPPYEQDPAGFNGLSTQTGYADQFAGGQQQYQDGQYPQQQPDNGFGSGPYVPGFQGPQYPDGPGGSGAHLNGGAPAPGVSRKRLLIGGGAVAAVAIIALAISFSASGSPGKPAASQSTSAAASPSATSPQAAAAAIYTLIQESGELRSNANTGVVDIVGCSNLGSAQSLLSSTAQQRTAQATNVAKINVSALSGGAQLVSALQQAWTASATSDSDFAKIVPDVSSNCSEAAVKADANYSAATSAGDTADTQKANATQLWNANPTTSALGQIDANSL